MNGTDFLEIGGGRIRHISPKFDKIGRICKPCSLPALTVSCRPPNSSFSSRRLGATVSYPLRR
jgi:hypothetical protein